MPGKNAGLHALVQQTVHDVTIWHWQVLVAVNSVTEPKDSVSDVKNVVNSISERGLGGNGAEHTVPLFPTAGKWFSRDQIMSRVVEVREEMSASM